MHPTRKFKTPKAVEKAFEEYKEDLKNQANEWLLLQYVGKEGDRHEDPQKVPMTMEGFYRFVRSKYKCRIKQYFANTDGLYDDFITICSDIKDEIRENQIIGGLLGFYNASITQRLNNLKETVEVEQNSKEVPLFLDATKNKQ